jgi:hypothetical protein
MENIREILHQTINDLILMSVEHEQARMVSRMNRMLGNQGRIKRKVKIGKLHGQPDVESLRVGLEE